jgi:hypothetical protein
MPVQPIPQRHHQQQRQRAAQLSHGDHHADRRQADGKIMGDSVQQRLRIINVGHANCAGGSQQQHQGGRQAP